MKCSICNTEMSPSGICPVCGNEANRSNVAITSGSSRGMDSFWVVSMEKARNIGGLLNWVGVIIALLGDIACRNRNRVYDTCSYESAYGKYHL